MISIDVEGWIKAGPQINIIFMCLESNCEQALVCCSFKAQNYEITKLKECLMYQYMYDACEIYKAILTYQALR